MIFRASLIVVALLFAGSPAGAFLFHGGKSRHLLPYGNVAPPPGRYWTLTLDDEFNHDARINRAMWNGPGSGPRGKLWPMCTDGPTGDVLGWAGNAACTAFFGTRRRAPHLTIVRGIGLFVQPLIDHRVPLPFSNRWARTQDWTGLQNYGHFSQMYGYFEVRAKMPHDNAGEGNGLHPDIFITVNHRTTECCSDEIDFGENDLGSGSTTNVHCVVNETPGNTSEIAMPAIPVGDLSTAFHTYAVYWRNTGSGHGTAQCYFDGIPQGAPTPLTDPGWASGVYIFPGWMQQLFSDVGPFWGGAAPSASTSNHNPLVIQYVRVWQSH